MTDVLTRGGLRRMVARDRHDSHRVSSPLELLFDLVFVVAVSQASSTLHHELSEGVAAEGVLSYFMVFFAIWWAWMNFTWFASAFDTDDWLYRVLTIAQMAGVLVLAAGVHDAMVSFDFLVVTWGYVIMRLAMVAQWLRAAVSDPAARPAALRFAIGIGIVQVLWVARLYLLDPAGQFWTFFVLVVAEVLVPVWGELHGRTAWHPHHIAERFGLFTLILLGESLLASANAVIDALDGSLASTEAVRDAASDHVPMADLLSLAASGLVITAAIWWIYFAREQHARLRTLRDGFRFGYAHYVIFAAVGAVSSGVEVEIDHLSGHSELSDAAAGLALTAPLAVFLLASWAILLRRSVAAWASVCLVFGAVAVGATGLLPRGEYISAALVMAALVVVVEVDEVRQARSSSATTARSSRGRPTTANPAASNTDIVP
ncbi:low temperature requirement protein A [Microbacterium sp. 10M-3C3]|jgi:low temperature requirement protein LtrA|uniref:low temperature requirement protein A n=1 Tax=Microbacterium sp. 10M-3C3 TaxID=2483401 RepID=UPI000F62CBDF|nr:low temperature requirement protein A [Microbacterium sp. 10M-3C3]